VLSIFSLKDELSRARSTCTLRKYQKVLDRWKAYAGIDEDFNKMQRAARKHRRAPLDVKDFINLVLSATWPIDRLVERDRMVKQAFDRCKDDIVAAVKETDFPLELLRHLQKDFVERFGERLRALDKSYYDFNKKPVSQKDQHGSRQRKAFGFTVGRYLLSNCGEWCDLEVAALVDIAYPRKNIPTTVEEVRSFRRPTTTGARASKL
jgi:hypothetical protein